MSAIRVRVSIETINHLASAITSQILAHKDLAGKNVIKLYGIPRGGIPVAWAVSQFLLERGYVVDSAEDADVIVDDIQDSGQTLARYAHLGKVFAVLISKKDYEPNVLVGYYDTSSAWHVFPWEHTVEHSAEDIPRRLLQFVGENPERGGLIETPKRFLKAWQHWTSGYGVDVASVLKVFEDGAEGCDQMVVRKDIPLYSHCEHHLAAIFGTCTIAYIPDGKVLGLSKLDRLVDVFARRLQVQERLTNQIADALWEHVKPKGVGVWINARHMCVESRGVQHRDSSTITTALRGCILTEDSARAEFLALARS